MKYTHKKLSVEVSNWLEDTSEYFSILAFLADVFKSEGHQIPVDIPVPSARLSQFHYNTKNWVFNIDNQSEILIDETITGKKLAATLITALTYYYSKHLNPADEAAAQELRERILENMVVELTLAEVALTSGLVVGGILAVKALVNKL